MTKQDYTKSLLNGLTEIDYYEQLKNLKDIKAFNASDCHPISKDMLAVMTNEASKKIEEFFDILKLDYKNDENLKDTPFRVASMYVNELMIGRFTSPPRIEAFPADYYYQKDSTTVVPESVMKEIWEHNARLDEIQKIFYSRAKLSDALTNELLTEVEGILSKISDIEKYHELYVPEMRNLVSKTIDINSLCSHHLISFVSTDDKNSKCVISYVPKIGSSKALLGISKLQRIADWFGRRPQLQETLNWQIRTFLCLILRTPDVMVSFHNIIHYCEKTRGVKSHCGSTSSIEFGGVFEKSTVRNLAFKITQ